MKKLFLFFAFALFSASMFATTYTVVGANEDIFGKDKSWCKDCAENDMTADGEKVFKWSKAGVTLAIGAYEYKIVEDHAWTKSYPQDGNATFPITKAGTYDLTFVLDLSGAEATYYVKAEPKTITGYATKVELKGSWNGWTDGLALTISDDKKTASAKLNLTAQETNYEFKLLLNETAWIGNNHEYHREYTGAENINENAGNMKLKADVTGDYIFTWTFATDGLQITFPAATGIENTAVESKAIKTYENGQLIVIKNGVKYNALGQIMK